MSDYRLTIKTPDNMNILCKGLLDYNRRMSGNKCNRTELDEKMKKSTPKDPP